MIKNYDFGGWATRNDLRCSDGRTIRKDAFKDNDGHTVPLVWQHQHNNPENILGHALLENRNEGVYAYCTFNDTELGQTAKELVRHGDIKSLSIYANQLKQKGSDVLHGAIREVSLVLAGANPGAEIIDLNFEHSDGSEDIEEALIYADYALEPHEDTIEHADEKEEPEVADNNEKTVQDVFDELTDEQKNVVYFMIGKALEDAEGGEDVGHSDYDDEGDYFMHQNVFEPVENRGNYLTHSDMETIFSNAKRVGSLRDAVNDFMDTNELSHAIDTDGMDLPTMTNQQYKTAYGYGINGIDFLFPEARALSDRPEFLKRDTDWVTKVMSGVHHTPFSRIKSVFANITEDEARAKGYLKGKMKKEEFFSLLKRATTPQTIYKKQKLDHDDVIDIVDFDVVAWIKGEMRLMLDEEIARAILIGDGRLASDDDHISEEHIRPIVSDKPLFTIQTSVTAGTTDEDTAKNIIKAAIKARKDYKGSGNPIFFTTEDVLTNMLLIEDNDAHFMYKSAAEIATVMRVSSIVTVPVLENFTNSDGNAVYGIIVNLADYNVGADKGGEVNMFDDFDIDYNQQKYLIETRISGALTKPYSAIVLSAAGNP